jgi:hypothetical protein
MRFISGLDVLERSNVSLTPPQFKPRIVQPVAWKLYSLRCTGVMQCEVKILNNILWWENFLTYAERITPTLLWIHNTHMRNKTFCWELYIHVAVHRNRFHFK